MGHGLLFGRGGRQREGGESGGGKVNWNSNESARVIVPSKKKN